MANSNAGYSCNCYRGHGASAEAGNTIRNLALRWWTSYLKLLRTQAKEEDHLCSHRMIDCNVIAPWRPLQKVWDGWEFDQYHSTAPQAINSLLCTRCSCKQAGSSECTCQSQKLPTFLGRAIENLTVRQNFGMWYIFAWNQQHTSKFIIRCCVPVEMLIAARFHVDM